MSKNHHISLEDRLEWDSKLPGRPLASKYPYWNDEVGALLPGEALLVSDGWLMVATCGNTKGYKYGQYFSHFHQPDPITGIQAPYDTLLIIGGEFGLPAAPAAQHRTAIQSFISHRNGNAYFRGSVRRGKDKNNLENLWSNSVVGVSLSNPGYIKFPNGLTIQWGATSTTPADIVFPLSFTSVYNMQCTALNSGENNARYSSLSVVGARIISTTPAGVSWLAIGFTAAEVINQAAEILNT